MSVGQYKFLDPRAAQAQLVGNYRDRFRKVIVSAGYTEAAADGILAEWLPKYLADLPSFVRMLERYEAAGGDPD